MLIVLFGLSGVGKNYTGRILVEDYGCTLYDADDDLPPDMRAAIVNGSIATDDMRDRHFAAIVARTRQHLAATDRLVVVGGFFKERHRRAFLRAFPQTLLIWVQTTPELRWQRLSKRQAHIASLAYAQKIDAVFEPPTLPHAVIANIGGEAEIRAQIAPILDNMLLG